MKIAPNMLLSELQKSFNTAYPLLKIKFYELSHGHHEGSPKKAEVTKDLALSVLNPAIEAGSITLADDLSVDALECQLESEFGLHVQVFRKSGEQWLQTSVTDHWPLAKHQQVAAEAE